MIKQNVAVAMSGGTTSVINSTLAGIIKAAKESKKISGIFAGCPGLLGLLHEQMTDLTCVSDEELNLLLQTPASGFVGTTRFRPMSDIEMKRLEDVFEAHNIGYFINIGGNGTIKQSIAIAKHFGEKLKVVAVPKTVDNDLGDQQFQKVLYTPGFLSCANYWCHKIHIMNQENLGAHSHDRVLIAQTFGRRTGFIAGCARLADKQRRLPLILLLPEDNKPLDSVLERIESSVKKHSRAIVIMSEGYEVGDIGNRFDPSEQIMYGSSVALPAQLLVNACIERGIQARAFIPGPDQRSDILFAVENDIKRAFEIGSYALREMLCKEKPFFASIARKNNKITNISVYLDEIENFSRVMPEDWLKDFDVSDSYVKYLESLGIHRTIRLRYGKDKLRPIFAKSRQPNVKKQLAPFVYASPAGIQV